MDQKAQRFNERMIEGGTGRGDRETLAWSPIGPVRLVTADMEEDEAKEIGIPRLKIDRRAKASRKRKEKEERHSSSYI
jgi:hypothetical protein